MEAAFWGVLGVLVLVVFFGFLERYADRIADLVGRRSQNGAPKA